MTMAKNNLIYRYKNGYRMPENVIKALHYLGKVGVLSTQDWRTYFCENKHRRWQYRKLQNLQKSNFIKAHTAESFKDKWILGTKGQELIYQSDRQPVHPVPATHVDHDETIGRSLLILEKEKLIQSWFVERELKMINQSDFKVVGDEGETKYPDAIFKIKVHNELKTVALEYEKNGKSQTRYRSILWNYAKLSNIDLIIFICEDQQIANRIESAFNYLKQPELFDRLAFVSAVEWKNSLLIAPIKMQQGVFRLKDVCTQF